MVLLCERCAAYILNLYLKDILMTFKYTLAVASFLFSCASIAESYQADLGVGAIRWDDNDSGNFYNNYRVGGSYYFNEVSTGGKPLAEAAYLGGNSNVFAGFTRSSYLKNDPSVEAYTAGAEFFIPESFLYVRAGAVRSSSSGKHSSDWFTTIGVTPVDGLLISTDYANDAGYDANLSAKYVTALGSDHFINIEAGVYDREYGTDKKVGGDFYFDSTLSIGGAVTEILEKEYYEVRTRKFFTHNFSGNLSYVDTPNGHLVNAGLNLRF